MLETTNKMEVTEAAEGTTAVGKAEAHLIKAQETTTKDLHIVENLQEEVITSLVTDMRVVEMMTRSTLLAPTTEIVDRAEVEVEDALKSEAAIGTISNPLLLLTSHQATLEILPRIEIQEEVIINPQGIRMNLVVTTTLNLAILKYQRD